MRSGSRAIPRGEPGARGADDREELTLVDVHVDVVDSPHDLRPALVEAAQLFGPNH
jgi:hypothetical protein